MKIGAKPKRKKQSPLKAKPLRNPGQSLDEEMQRLLDEEVYFWLTTAFFCIALLAYEWWRWYSKTPPNPAAVTAVALPLIAYSIFKIYRVIGRIRRLKMARDGEKAVGQYLADLRENGYRIFHDIVGNGFNVDHVIISDRGIFTVETKTHSKPTSGKATITFDGETIQVNGYIPERDVVTQAKAQASWIQEIIQESTGKQFPVKPVVVFPGWFVETTQTPNKSGLWVLNPKALPSFLQHEPTCLSPEDLKLAAYHLSRHIRTT